jgi:hypothetical protein
VKASYRVSDDQYAWEREKKHVRRVGRFMNFNALRGLI